MQYLFVYERLIPLEAFLFAFLITFVAIPSIIEVSRLKHLYDVPGDRASHSQSTPTLGGLAIFAGFVISTMVFVYIPDIPFIQYVIAGIIIVFFVGLKDDVIAVSPMLKILGILLAATIIIDLGDIRLNGLYGLFGITDIGYYGSDFLSLFVIVAIVNAFNLIDGINGLASGVAILATTVFGGWFLLIGEVQLAILAFALCGSLLAFFRYNVFSKKNRIFMGDIGSLMVGFIMAILAIKFNDINSTLGQHPYRTIAAPAVSVGILIVPIYDTIRVFFVRLYHKRSPFSADKEHVHHYMLELMNGSHKKATAIILFVNVLFIVLAFSLSHLRIHQLFLILIALAAVLSGIPYFLVVRKRKNQK